MIALGLNLIGFEANCIKQLPYKVNGWNYFHACSLYHRWHYFALVQSFFLLPFYYIFQPSHNLTKALCTTSPFIKNLKRSLNYTVYLLTAMKTVYRTLVVNIYHINGHYITSQLVKNLLTLA